MVSKRAKVGLALGGVAALATIAIVAGTAHASEREEEDRSPGLPPGPPSPTEDPDAVVVTPPDREGMPNGPPVVVTPPPAPPTAPPPPDRVEPAPPVPTAPTEAPIHLKAGRTYRFKVRIEPPLPAGEWDDFVRTIGSAGAASYDASTGEGLFSAQQKVDRSLRRGDVLIDALGHRLIFLGAIELERMIEPPAQTPVSTAPPEEPDLPPVEAEDGEGDFAQPTEIGDLETDPENDPNGTIGLARMLIARETAPDWRTDLQDDVKEWQEAVGLTPDGKLGLNGIARMAEEVGMLPLVRFWTVGQHWDRWSAMDGQHGYRKRMAPIIARLKADPETRAHARALEESMERQASAPVGSAFPPYPTTAGVNSLQQVAKIVERLEAEAEDDAAEMIRRVS